ncbi:16S rRNA methyltransferase [Sulfolobus sp. S-194]|uniref:16S rRNA methyltransferase n=1 Tax=Sulfolobus sp. S-194 TaxID=2512240 RepID=UPI0014372FBD|nr:16S rRNA methyltransferase [Sulfolobus sp. S-194]QIW24923.1 16S rRNA methyltransferase [Sulfolobus sp. S-194]
MKINLILLDSSLELVPKEIASHPAVIRNAKKRNKKPEHTILDISLHYHAMKKLPNWRKRGRPDIIHLALLMFLTEKTPIKGEVYIHTIDGKIVYVNSDMRPPKNYNRFIGLAEQLLLHGQVPINNANPLMKILNIKLTDLKSKYKIGILSEDGKKVTPEELCNLGENWLLGVGAFPHGDFSEEIKSVADEYFSISNYKLETHQVICRIISACLQQLGWP